MRTTLLGTWLAENGISPNDRVLVSGENSLEFALLYFASMLGYFTIVPFRETETETGKAGMIQATSATAMVSIDKEGTYNFLNLLDHSENELKRLRETKLPRGLQIKSFDQEFCSIHFTSGTTAHPKGVPHKTMDFVCACNAFNSAVGIDANTRIYHTLPMTYMAGFMNTLVSPFIAGGSIVIGRSFDARSLFSFWRTAQDNQVNSLWLVPAIAWMLLKIEKSSSVRKWVQKNINVACIGTAPASPDLLFAFKNVYGIDLLESYGTTEALYHTAQGSRHLVKPGFVGKPLEGVTVVLVDPKLGKQTKSPLFEVGIECNWVADAYLTRAGTKKLPRTEGGAYLTGDLGSVDGEGYLRIDGRVSESIIRGGINVSPRSIEECILNWDEVAEVAVVAEADQILGERVIVCYVSANHTELSEDDVINRCRELFDKGICPDKAIKLESLPKTITGKIQKSKVKKLIM